MEKNQAGAQFRFRKNESIGNADAESDERFLLDCFLDTGDLDALRDCDDSRRLIIGRTGAGKSALLRVLAEREEHVIQLNPAELSLSYLANSEVLRFFENAGANLDVFYQLLWKHVLAVELIKNKYKITNDASQRSFLERLSGLFIKDVAKEKAIKYLQEWGADFWNETESRIREVTKKIETDLKASIAGSIAQTKFDAGAAEKLTEEERHDVVTRGARAVNQVQIASLSKVLKILADDVFNDSQESCYVVIDDLDTHWVDDTLKYKLVRALIETCRTFKQVRRVKIIVALRLDLLQRVIDATRDSGFQAEKYESMYLNLRWTNAQLVEMINRRLTHLIRQRYTSRTLSIEEIFPQKIHQSKFKEFLCDRTFLRPRDAILLVNECLIRATDRNQITAQMVIDAESSYSEKRLISLSEEWAGTYPDLSKYIKILARRPPTFPVSELHRGYLENWAMNELLLDNSASDPIAISAQAIFLDGKGSPLNLALKVVDALYVVGAVGVKPDPQSQVYWSYYSDHRPAVGALKPSSTISIHPTFWRALGVVPKINK